MLTDLNTVFCSAVQNGVGSLVEKVLPYGLIFNFFTLDEASPVFEGIL